KTSSSTRTATSTTTSSWSTGTARSSSSPPVAATFPTSSSSRRRSSSSFATTTSSSTPSSRAFTASSIARTAVTSGRSCAIPGSTSGAASWRRLVELSEFAERVDNTLKVIGDFYLARVYESAVRRFRIRAWQASIDAKQALLAQAYSLIRGQIDARRTTLLELVVIVLIVVEVLLALRH